MKFSIFTGEKIICILHGQVYVMPLYMPGLNVDALFCDVGCAITSEKSHVNVQQEKNFRKFINKM